MSKPDGIVVTMPVKFLLDLADGDLIQLQKEYCKEQGITVCREDYYLELVRSKYNFKKRIQVGYYLYLKQMQAVMADQDSYWMHKISAVPTIDVLFCYITVLGRIHYRANIGGYEPGSTLRFEDRRDCTAKHWMILTHPFVKATEKIPYKGMQGFRYTEKLF